MNQELSILPSGEPMPAAKLRRLSRAIVATAVLALLAGCAMTTTDSVTVGAVPDDYRTNHPIMIAEKDQIIDLPVGASDRGMTGTQKVALGGFLDDYDRSAAPVLTILVPRGSRNELAASQAGAEFAQFAKKRGVPPGRVTVSSYAAQSGDTSAPVRVMYTAMRAQTNKCGRWPEDIAQTGDNKHYANFGCSYQNNMAAQIANPADLLGPRKMTEIDAERRSVVIDDYRRSTEAGRSEVDY